MEIIQKAPVTREEMRNMLIYPVCFHVDKRAKFFVNKLKCPKITKTYEIVTTNVKSLGFETKAPLKDIYVRVSSLGLNLCKPNILFYLAPFAPELFSFGRRNLYIGSMPMINMNYGMDYIFFLSHETNRFEIQVQEVPYGTTFKVNESFVFVK